VSPSSRSSVPLGASWDDGAVTFGVYSTRARTVTAEIVDEAGRVDRTTELRPVGGAVFVGRIDDVDPGALYSFCLDGARLPDPYARWLPKGVHGPAAVVDAHYAWKYPNRPRALDDSVFYELHVGTFTQEGTYRAAFGHLGQLADLGVTTIELMPIATFPGRRGWGYDGVAPFAPFPPYGAPNDLRQFVDQAHALGLSVVLDVVYNHFGPDGNYLAAYSPEYFTESIPTPWGAAPNFANPFMRELVLSNARSWLTDYRFDGLRLDATHSIVDRSPRHILRELADEVAALSPKRLLVAEDERNLPALVEDFGMDGIWADDFHHQLHVLTTGEKDGYYACYRPSVDDLAQTVRTGWLYEGQTWALSGEPRGRPASGLALSSFVLSIQNHDQVGNRALGDRLLSSAQADRLAALTMLLLFLPATPLLFMGQEWGASSPFLYFTDHEPELGAKVSRGRREEFRHFAAFEDRAAVERIPDPQAEDTFLRSKLDWTHRASPAARKLLAVTRYMLRLRREDAVLRPPGRGGLDARAVGNLLVVSRGRGERRLLVVSFDDSASSVDACVVPDDAQLLVASDLGAWSDRRLAPRAAAIFRVP
jgi:maltooligosyltrehalose trehalohydrolase